MPFGRDKKLPFSNCLGTSIEEVELNNTKYERGQ